MPDVPHPRTLTHARLRRAQGDVRGAIAILEALIDAGDDGDELRTLYLALGGDGQRTHHEPDLAAAEDLRRPGPDELARLGAALRRESIPNSTAAKIRRLERWVTGIRRRDG